MPPGCCNAAKVSRALGYPARHEPEMVITGFLIPIGNLFLSYRALSDLLPPDHPLRPSCLNAWLTYLFGGIACGLAGDAGVFGSGTTPVAVIFLLAGAGWLMTAARLGLRLINAVEELHTSALQRLGGPM
jgi:hypothetical protein